MQDSIDSGISPEVLKPLVIRALRRSSVRKKIAEYLFDISPSASYTSEIAHQVKTTPTNVIGAIRGMGTRYKKNESLINLNIIEPIELEFGLYPCFIFNIFPGFSGFCFSLFI